MHTYVIFKSMFYDTDIFMEPFNCIYTYAGALYSFGASSSSCGETTTLVNGSFSSSLCAPYNFTSFVILCTCLNSWYIENPNKQETTIPKPKKRLLSVKNS